MRLLATTLDNATLYGVYSQNRCKMMELILKKKSEEFNSSMCLNNLPNAWNNLRNHLLHTYEYLLNSSNINDIRDIPTPTVGKLKLMWIKSLHSYTNICPFKISMHWMKNSIHEKLIDSTGFGTTGYQKAKGTCAMGG